MGGSLCEDVPMTQACVVGPKPCGGLTEYECFYDDCNPPEPASAAPTAAPTAAATSIAPAAPSALPPCESLPAGAAPPAPRVVSAVFTSTLAAVDVGFDAPTDRAGFSAGATFACSEVLSMAGGGGDVSECSWSDDRTIYAVVSLAPKFLPGSTVALAPGVVGPACSRQERCDCVEAAASSADAAAPAAAVAPDVLLQGPTSAAICEGFVARSQGREKTFPLASVRV